MTRARLWSRLWRELKPVVWLVLLTILYGILRAVFASKSETRGLLTAGGATDEGFLVLGITVLVLRIVVLVAIPLVVSYRIVRRLLEFVHDRRNRVSARNESDERSR